MLMLTVCLALASPSATTAASGAIAPPVEAPRLLVLNLEPANISPDEGRAIDALVLAGARSDDVVTVSQTELQQLAALDAAAQVAGCDTSSCLAEIAGALGARYVLFGTSSRLGSTSTVSLAVLDAASGRTVRDTVTVDNVDALPQRVPASVRALLAQALSATPAPSLPDTTPWTPVAVTGAAVAGLGGAAAVTGLAVAGWSEFVILRDSAARAADKRDAQGRGFVALVGAGVGIVVVAAGTALFVIGGAP